MSIQACTIDYKKGEQGKPFLSGSDSEHLQFNLSHTQDLAILAVTRKTEVGIDIEYNDRKTDWKGICKRFFTIPEQDSLFALSDTQQEMAFFDLWTRKEAYMKVLGTGLSLSPTEFTLTVYPEKPALIQHHSLKFDSLEQVEFTSIDLPEQLGSYSATLAVAASNIECSYYTFSG